MKNRMVNAASRILISFLRSVQSYRRDATPSHRSPATLAVIRAIGSNKCATGAGGTPAYSEREPDARRAQPCGGNDDTLANIANGHRPVSVKLAARIAKFARLEWVTCRWGASGRQVRVRTVDIRRRWIPEDPSLRHDNRYHSAARELVSIDVARGSADA
jgi:hypothetical protein